MSLLHACRAGDRHAWRTLFNERADQIYRWAVLLGLPAADAKDAAQDVLATAARKIDACPSDDALGPWLFQITRRVVANARRRRWLQVLLALDDGAHGAAFEHTDPHDAERELAVRRCLDKLSRAHREVLVLTEIEGHTRQEVAEMLELPAGTVASRLRLAREAFRHHWDEQAITSGSIRLSWGKP